MGSELKGILFDFDDTLIDWSEVDFNWREIETRRLHGVLDYIRNDVHEWDVEIEDLVNRYMDLTREAWSQGRSTLRAPNMPNVLVQSVKELGLPETKIDRDDLIRAYDWGIVPGTRVFPDVPSALQTFVDNGIKIGIVTNASQPMMMRDVEVELHELMPYFPHCRISAADAGYLKPHPRIFQHALGLLGTEPDATVFIGDNPVADIAGAQAVGMKAVLRVNKTMRPMISGLIVPDAAINTFYELLNILDDWYPGWRDVD